MHKILITSNNNHYNIIVLKKKKINNRESTSSWETPVDNEISLGYINQKIDIEVRRII